mgnify:CR=1 FL=1
MVLRKDMVLRFDIFYVRCFYIDIVIMVSISDSTFNIRALLIFLIYIISVLQYTCRIRSCFVGNYNAHLSSENTFETGLSIVR